MATLALLQTPPPAPERAQVRRDPWSDGSWIAMWVAIFVATQSSSRKRCHLPWKRRGAPKPPQPTA